MAGVGAAIVGGVRLLFTKIDSHDQRIADLERDTVLKEDHNKDLSEVYSKIDAGFSQVGTRLDNLYTLLLEKLPK
jgi:hypothetical protein